MLDVQVGDVEQPQRSVAVEFGGVQFGMCDSDAEGLSPGGVEGGGGDGEVARPYQDPD